MQAAYSSNKNPDSYNSSQSEYYYTIDVRNLEEAQDLLQIVALKEEVHWTMKANGAFDKIKQELVSSTVLDWRMKFMVSVLLQKHGTKLRPVDLNSKKLDMVWYISPTLCTSSLCSRMAVEVSAEII